MRFVFGWVFLPGLDHLVWHQRRPCNFVIFERINCQRKFVVFIWGVCWGLRLSLSLSLFFFFEYLVHADFNFKLIKMLKFLVYFSSFTCFILQTSACLNMYENYFDRARIQCLRRSKMILFSRNFNSNSNLRMDDRTIQAYLSQSIQQKYNLYWPFGQLWN